MINDDGQRAAAPEYSVPAVVAAVLGIGSLVLTAFPLLATIAAIAAIAIALTARRQLKANPTMRGFAISLVGFLAGIWVAATEGIPSLFALALVMPA